MVKVVSVSPEINDNACYPLSGLEALGFGKKTLSLMRRKGLAVRRVGRRSYVFGSDLMTFIRSHGRIVM